MASNLRRLRDLGESNSRIAQLLEINASDVRKALASTDADTALSS